MIFVDANVWIALHNKEDSLHSQAVKRVDAMEKLGSAVVINNFVFAASSSVLTHNIPPLPAQLMTCDP